MALVQNDDGTTSDTTEQGWYVPYVTVTLNEDGLIDANEFDIQFEMWNLYSDEWTDLETDLSDTTSEELTGSATAITETLDKDSEYIDYDLVWGNTEYSGSYPLKIAALTNGSVDGYFMITWGQNGVERPYFKDRVDSSDSGVTAVGEPLHLDSMHATFAAATTYYTNNGWDVGYTVVYQNEVGTIKAKWQQYSTTDDSLPDSFSDGLDDFVSGLSGEVYGFSPSTEEPSYNFKKTKRTPVKLDKLSSFATGEMADSSVSVTTSTTTTMEGSSY
jgi:hypothetical protein